MPVLFLPAFLVEGVPDWNWMDTTSLSRALVRDWYGTYGGS